MKWTIGQYWIFRPACTIVAVVTRKSCQIIVQKRHADNICALTEWFNLYCLASWSPQYSHLWTSALITVSVTIALYGLMQFYVTMKVELKPYDPLLKFFAVKAVVFLTFWQESSLTLLGTLGVIKPTTYWTTHEIIIGYSALLSCVEMAIFGFLHLRCFTANIYKPTPLENGDQPGRRVYAKTSAWKALGDVLDFRDVFRDVWLALTQMGRRSIGKEIEKPEPDDHLEIVFGRSRIMDRKARKDQKATVHRQTDIEKELERIKLQGQSPGLDETEKLLAPLAKDLNGPRIALEQPRHPETRQTANETVPWGPNTTTAFSPSMHSPAVPLEGGFDAYGMSFGDVRRFPKSSTGVIYPLASPNFDEAHARIRSPAQPRESEIAHNRTSHWVTRVWQRSRGSGAYSSSGHTPLPTQSQYDGPVDHNPSLPYDHVPVPACPAQPARVSSGPPAPRNGLRMPGPLSPSRYPGFDEQAHVDRMYAMHALQQVAQSVTASPQPRASEGSYFEGPRPQLSRPGPSSGPGSGPRRTSAVFMQPPSITSPVPTEFGGSAIVLPRHNLPPASIHSLPSSEGSERRSRPYSYAGGRDSRGSSRGRRMGQGPQGSYHPGGTERGASRRHSADQPRGLGLSFSPTPGQIIPAAQGFASPVQPPPFSPPPLYNSRDAEPRPPGFVFDDY